MNKTRRRKLLILLSWVAVILWMAFIFYLSSQVVDQSRMLSEGITNAGIGAVEKVAPGLHFDLTKLNILVRKNAHFFAFLALSILVINAGRRSGLKGLRWFLLGLGFCILYAISDEIHQLFVPGRGAQVLDVLIDSAGVFVGSIIYKSASLLRARWRHSDIASRIK
ncbi:MAG TPA: VanZ family protein, partial [Desulfitobacteriaceae bacterium]|nr:VanZ family protein [Desulfitobacteriaceae bacterium]